MDCLIWNVRGLNQKEEQRDILNFLKCTNFEMLALLETKVQPSNAEKIKRHLFGPSHTSISHVLGRSSRIWLFWKTALVNITLLQDTDQYLHCQATQSHSQSQFLHTFVYASNDFVERLDLWQQLTSPSRSVYLPWMVGEDFIEVWFTIEKVGGSPLNVTHLNNFNDCIDSCGLMDVSSYGNTLSWTNRQETCIMSRLDHIMANHDWLLLHPEALVLSDHAAKHLSPIPLFPTGPKPFKFFNA
ncbi:hypothetical protein QJS10_CPB13g01270 [Acorus calamus]|uniref:Endonuclease/exonuclease/phosphatase domain-containing protein n=1 Tax=Acorus calamus TaxID=4465 RepID=A0AAV9DH90_ACOCL|nr:hypothetical protein QJS10_CPB13g01270 [Acorus calamus]